MKRVSVKITGKTPLLQHKMDQEALFGLLGAKTGRKKDKEELTPRQIAEKAVYQRKDGRCFIPSEYIIGSMAHVAGDYKQKNSIRKSLKSVIKGACRTSQGEIDLSTPCGEPIKDFEVDVRKATNHQAGAVAVCRPRFDEWACEFELEIDDSLVSIETCCDILNDAGKRSGIGSFRVQRGGYFGQFMVTEFKKLETDL